MIEKLWFYWMAAEYISIYWIVFTLFSQKCGLNVKLKCQFWWDRTSQIYEFCKKKNQKLGALSKTIRQLNIVLSSFQTKCDGLSEQKDLWINWITILPWQMFNLRTQQWCQKSSISDSANFFNHPTDWVTPFVWHLQTVWSNW